jgi:hypothetical protein
VLWKELGLTEDEERDVEDEEGGVGVVCPSWCENRVSDCGTGTERRERTSGCEKAVEWVSLFGLVSSVLSPDLGLAPLMPCVEIGFACEPLFKLFFFDRRVRFSLCGRASRFGVISGTSSNAENGFSGDTCACALFVGKSLRSVPCFEEREDGDGLSSMVR